MYNISYKGKNKQGNNTFKYRRFPTIDKCVEYAKSNNIENFFIKIDEVDVKERSELYLKVLQIKKEKELSYKKLATLFGLTNHHLRSSLSGVKKMTKETYNKIIEGVEKHFKDF